MVKPKLLHVVADYASGDLAFSEMVTALVGHLDDANWMIHTTPVPSFDTLGTGFIVAQLALAERRPEEMIVYANCAPRTDLKAARANNAGEKLDYCVLDNGVPVLIVNSGYSLSFIKPRIKEMFSVSCPRGGSQFRSRDLFPPLVGMLARKDLSFVVDRLNPQEIVDYPKGVVAYTDNFGNMKTTWRVGDAELAGFASGQRVTVTINGQTRVALVSDGSFNAVQGEIVLAPGSSGFEQRFYEVFLRGGSASRAFGSPATGALIEIQPVMGR